MQETVEPIWHMGRGRYQALKGVHRPWIGEIHPGVQYARLSNRAKTVYDAKREAEWAASAECAKQYAADVVAAYLAGAFTLDTPGLNGEAKDAVLGHLVREQDAAEATAKQARLDANRIPDLASVLVGMRVHDLMSRRYGVVSKKHKVSVLVQFDDGTSNKVGLGCLWYRSYNDCVEDRQPLPVSPRAPESAEDDDAEVMAATQHGAPGDPIEVCRRIVKDFACEEHDGVVIDVQSANAVVTVFDALSERNQARMRTMPVPKCAAIAWQLVGVAKHGT